MRKPWQTPAWRKRREEILKTRNKCEWCGSQKILTMDHITPLNSLTDERYVALRDEDIIVLCRRCAYARQKGRRLCPICKTNYRKQQYDMCWKCYAKTEKGKKSLEEWAELETEEEVPLVEVTLPCLEKVQVYEDQFQYGGITETCMHQCPHPETKGDVNNCEAFAQYISNQPG